MCKSFRKNNHYSIRYIILCNVYFDLLMTLLRNCFLKKCCTRLKISGLCHEGEGLSILFLLSLPNELKVRRRLLNRARYRCLIKLSTIILARVRTALTSFLLRLNYDKPHHQQSKSKKSSRKRFLVFMKIIFLFFHNIL